MKLRTLMSLRSSLPSPHGDIASPFPPRAVPAPERRPRVIQWADVQQAITGPAAPRSTAPRDPSHDGAPPSTTRSWRSRAARGPSREDHRRAGADVRAAVATAPTSRRGPASPAAHWWRSTRPTPLLTALPGGDAIVEGVRVGQQASAAMLRCGPRRLRQHRALRVQHVPPPMGVHADAGCPPRRCAAAGGRQGRRLTPFTLPRADVFRPTGPTRSRQALRRDFLETRDSAESPARYVRPTDRRRLVLGREPVRALEPQPDGLATARPERAKTAGLFAMVHTAGRKRSSRLRGEVSLPRLAAADGDPAGDYRRQPGDRGRRRGASAHLGHHPSTRRGTASGRPP